MGYFIVTFEDGTEEKFENRAKVIERLNVKLHVFYKMLRGGFDGIKIKRVNTTPSKKNKEQKGKGIYRGDYKVKNLETGEVKIVSNYLEISELIGNISLPTVWKILNNKPTLYSKKFSVEKYERPKSGKGDEIKILPSCK